MIYVNHEMAVYNHILLFLIKISSQTALRSSFKSRPRKSRRFHKRSCGPMHHVSGDDCEATFTGAYWIAVFDWGSDFGVGSLVVQV